MNSNYLTFRNIPIELLIMYIHQQLLGSEGNPAWSYTMRQNGSPSYRHLHKPYWFIIGPFGKDYDKQDEKYWLKQAKYCILFSLTLQCY